MRQLSQLTRGCLRVPAHAFHHDEQHAPQTFF